jgi:hypothetical protein
VFKIFAALWFAELPFFKCHALNLHKRQKLQASAQYVANRIAEETRTSVSVLSPFGTTSEP